MSYRPFSPFSSPEGNLPYTGIATFAGYPLWNGEKGPEAVLLGVPFDEGTTYRPGARFGPRAIRDASMFYSYEGVDGRFYDTDRKRWILKGKNIVDGGDVAIEPLTTSRNHELITDAIRFILSKDCIPATVGGDHSITYPVIKGFNGRRFHYLHLDSHIDADREFESNLTHGSPVYNIINDGLAESVTILGVRGLTNSGHDVAWLEEQGIKIITARELRIALKEKKNIFIEGDYYLSLDIDFFDPSLAPGTGTPEPGGLFFHEFSDLLYLLSEKAKIVGFDLVEVSPLLDNQSGITSHLAARCIIEMLEMALS